MILFLAKNQRSLGNCIIWIGRHAKEAAQYAGIQRTVEVVMMTCYFSMLAYHFNKYHNIQATFNAEYAEKARIGQLTTKIEVAYGSTSTMLVIIQQIRESYHEETYITGLYALLSVILHFVVMKMSRKIVCLTTIDAENVAG